MHVVLAEELAQALRWHRPPAGAAADDDVRVGCYWKKAMTGSFARVNSEVVGGAAAGLDADGMTHAPGPWGSSACCILLNFYGSWPAFSNF